MVASVFDENDLVAVVKDMIIEYNNSIYRRFL
jgi:hypothetical protein